MWKEPIIGGVCPEIYSILPQLRRAPGGGNIFGVCHNFVCHKMYVTILKNQYKTKTNIARMLIFFCGRYLP